MNVGNKRLLSKLKRRLKFLTSMRVHSFAVIVCVGILSAIVLALVARMDYKKNGIDATIVHALSYGNKVANKLNGSAYCKNSGNQSDITKDLVTIADIYEGRIIVTNDRLKIISDTYGLENGKTLLSPEVIKGLKGTSSQYRNEVNDTVELTIPIQNTIEKTGEKYIAGILVFIFSIAENQYALSSMDARITLFMIILSIVLIIFSYFFSRHFTKPLKAITQSLRHVTEGYLDDTVSIKGYLEMERISDSFNEMLRRIKLLEESRQEFVSNVSHELKTPITSIKVLADSLLMQEEAPVELYREFLADINDEIERENKIITDLLSLVKLDQKTGDLHIAEVNINELLEIILKRLKPIAQKRNIEITFESFRPVFAEVDEVKLSLALSNLIENAVKYNVEDGWVRVSLNSDHKYFYITVADSGIGIPQEEQNLIFDRFYRVDKTRTRDTGGTGLGLAITKNAIIMHKGAIKVYSKDEEGTTFTLRIPLSFISS